MSTPCWWSVFRICVQSTTGLQVVYCGNCSLPPEYCEFGPKPIFKKCKKWHGENGIGGDAGGVDVEENAETKEEEEEEITSKKGKKEDRKAAEKVKAAEKKFIHVIVNMRNKKKAITIVRGLETHGVDDLKAAAKKFSKKFACSATASKNVKGCDSFVFAEFFFFC